MQINRWSMKKSSSDSMRNDSIGTAKQIYIEDDDDIQEPNRGNGAFV